MRAATAKSEIKIPNTEAELLAYLRRNFLEKPFFGKAYINTRHQRESELAASACVNWITQAAISNEWGGCVPSVTLGRVHVLTPADVAMYEESRDLAIVPAVVVLPVPGEITAKQAADQTKANEDRRSRLLAEKTEAQKLLQIQV
jgi:hypothetical protein